MTDLKASKVVENETSLYETAMNAKSKFASKEVAIAATSKKLEDLAQKNGCSVSELLHKAETSSKFEEDFLEARHLRMTLSSLKKM